MNIVRKSDCEHRDEMSNREQGYTRAHTQSPRGRKASPAAPQQRNAGYEAEAVSDKRGQECRVVRGCQLTRMVEVEVSHVVPKHSSPTDANGIGEEDANDCQRDRHFLGHGTLDGVAGQRNLWQPSCPNEGSKRATSVIQGDAGSQYVALYFPWRSLAIGHRCLNRRRRKRIGSRSGIRPASSRRGKGESVGVRLSWRVKRGLGLILRGAKPIPLAPQPHPR